MRISRKLLLSAIVTLLLMAVLAASVYSVSGAAFTTFNPWVDGAEKDVCKNSAINCNIYGAKEYVWINGGPAANGLGPDGDYFFAVLVPGGQPNPNDGGAKNLSDDFDTVGDRTFTVTGGEISSYEGPHWLDSGNFLDPDRRVCRDKNGCLPDGEPPLIRLFPYADTTNPGGVYILAVCTLENGYPVDPRDCKYDAFKVKPQLNLSFRLEGMKFEDLDADGEPREDGEPALPGWDITIVGTGFLGEAINVTVQTGDNGVWEYQKDYTVNNLNGVYPAQLEVCEVLKDGWTQSFPGENATTFKRCHYLEIMPSFYAEVTGLDFGNWYPGEKSGMKFEDLYADGKADWVDDYMDPGLEGWTIYVDYNSNEMWDEGEPFAVTNEYGAYTITGITPGTWFVREVLQNGWTCSFPDPCYYEETFYSRAVFEDNDFGNWWPVDVTACKERALSSGGTVPVEGWEVALTNEGVIVDTQFTGEDGCYTWTGLTPGVSYDLHEEERFGWMPLGPVDVVFDRAQSGDSFSHTFVNAVLEGCTPGFWQGGYGRWLWDEVNDPQWAGAYDQPFYQESDFCSFFGCPDGMGGETMWYYVNPNMWPNASDPFDKAARSLVAAYLNASWGIFYPYSQAELMSMWDDAITEGGDWTLETLHTELDNANNAYYRFSPPPYCPIGS